MRYTWIDEYLTGKPGVVKDHKSEWNWDRYMIAGKLFAAVCYADDGTAVYVTLKLEPLESELLRAQYPDIIPGYYMNKLHWSSVKADGAVPDELLRSLLDSAYRLILHSLSKKTQLAITQGTA